MLWKQLEGTWLVGLADTKMDIYKILLGTFKKKHLIRNERNKIQEPVLPLTSSETPKLMSEPLTSLSFWLLT